MVAVALDRAKPTVLDEAMLMDSVLECRGEMLELFAGSRALFIVQICLLRTRAGSGSMIFEQVRQTQPGYRV